MTRAPSSAGVRAGTSRPGDLALLRWSLVAVWLGTALASAVEANGRSAALLAAAGPPTGAPAALVLWGGIAFDAAMGVVLAFAPRRLAATLGLAATILMTAVTTVLLPGEWLAPLGPLLKNLPILAALVVLRRSP